MNVADVIANLKSAQHGSRRLDGQIAQLLGWQLQIVDDPSRPKGKRYLWTVPNEQNDAVVPSYTTNLTAAYELAQKVVPSNVGGFAWKDGAFQAQIGLNTPVATAATPAIAICIAALQHLAVEAD
ncbi:hypothetical protein SAMN02982989_0656 [Xaviernesmea oryzae]|jgi:hypothetical protein|uniref:Phage ABA sandwich domain-containing protein n=1 Tax=Xaviernesmea oryzae TaxID=464029 RepID=A0A1X7FSC4_9HYPH|nr:hypothetical protein [Xaviernesmea oryzae]SMF57900.1 hypothetical protein SAMN02982989_0656 [Xaviernesmea oryzae]